MKEYICLTIVAMEMGKKHFRVIIATVAKRKKCFL